MSEDLRQAIRMNDFVAQWAAVRELTKNTLDRVGQSGWYILGTEVKTFETALASFWKFKHAAGVGNGQDAIEIGLRALGIQPGEKVLTISLSAFATTLAIIRCGAVPVFIDVDERGGMDLGIARKYLEAHPETRFVLPVHLYGIPLDLQELARLKEDFNLKIVEDCAQSIGATWSGQHTGSVGQVAATSFYPTKNLGCMGDGGAVLTNDDILAEKIKCLRNYGQSSRYIHDEVGMNSRLDELQAALLKDALLPNLLRWTSKRIEIADSYRSGIRNKKIKQLRILPAAQPCWHLFPIIVEKNREGFMKYMQAEGIETGVHYPKLIHLQNAAKAAVGTPTLASSLERSEYFASSEVSLPIHPHLTNEQVQLVIDASNAWTG